jgi:hypothetical protein
MRQWLFRLPRYVSIACQGFPCSTRQQEFYPCAQKFQNKACFVACPSSLRPACSLFWHVPWPSPKRAAQPARVNTIGATLVENFDACCRYNTAGSASASTATSADRWRYQPSEYVAMRSSNSAIPSMSTAGSNYVRGGPSSLPSNTGLQSNYGSKPSQTGLHSATSMLESSSRPMFSPGTASIHRDLDSVLDDIKRELGKSRPDIRLSLSIDGGSTQGLSSGTGGSSAAASFAASRDSVAQRIDSLRSRLDSVARHEAVTLRSSSTATASSIPRSDAGDTSSSSLLDSMQTPLSAANTAPPLTRSELSSHSSLLSSASQARVPDISSPSAPENKEKEGGKNANINLAEGWEMKLDSPSGRIFYVNHTLKAISWEPPLPPTPPSKTTSKSAALDHLSERTKALGAKLRDEMKIEAKQSTVSPYKSSSGIGSTSKTTSSLLDAKKDVGGKSGKDGDSSSSSTSAGLASARLAADLSRFSISSPR